MHTLRTCVESRCGWCTHQSFNVFSQYIAVKLSEEAFPALGPKLPSATNSVWVCRLTSLRRSSSLASCLPSLTLPACITHPSSSTITLHHIHLSTLSLLYSTVTCSLFWGAIIQDFHSCFREHLPSASSAIVVHDVEPPLLVLPSTTWCINVHISKLKSS